jgi:hypothetical protein
LALTTPSSAEGESNCAMMQRLAQQHSNDMARRNSLDHAGFHSRAMQGARAENVAMGNSTEAATMAQWRNSPGHAANLRLPGCKAVAHAVSQSGRYYWTMEIGDVAEAGATGRVRVRQAAAGRVKVRQAHARSDDRHTALDRAF